MANHREREAQPGLRAGQWKLAQNSGSTEGLDAIYPAWRATGLDRLLGQPKLQFRVAHKDKGWTV